MDKNEFNKILSRLDSSATAIEKLASQGKIKKTVAATIVRHLDSVADRVQVAAFGADSLRQHKAKIAKVLEKGQGDKVVDTFQNPNKVLESSGSEPFSKSAQEDQSAGLQDLHNKTWPKTASSRSNTASTWSK